MGELNEHRKVQMAIRQSARASMMNQDEVLQQQTEEGNNNPFCFGCDSNGNKKQNVISNSAAKIDITNNDTSKSKDKVLNSLLDQLNELEKLLHNSKSELINKMNKINQNTLIGEK